MRSGVFRRDRESPPARSRQDRERGLSRRPNNRKFCGGRQAERRLAVLPSAMSARLSDYDYVLPKELIARRPPERREDARMMVLHRGEQQIEHRKFTDLRDYLAPGDLLVLNNTRVMSARRFSDDGKIEFLFLERLGSSRWKCLVKPGRKMRVGATLA